MDDTGGDVCQLPVTSRDAWSVCKTLSLPLPSRFAPAPIERTSIAHGSFAHLPFLSRSLHLSFRTREAKGASKWRARGRRVLVPGILVIHASIVTSTLFSASSRLRRSINQHRSDTDRLRRSPPRLTNRLTLISRQVFKKERSEAAPCYHAPFLSLVPRIDFYPSSGKGSVRDEERYDLCATTKSSPNDDIYVYI